jgi:hypothetical protein
MSQLVIFLEERSAKYLLDEFLPRILPKGVTHRCIPFEGKQDLDKNIERRIRGWIAPSTAFMILRDQDHSDCVILKQSLYAKAQRAGRSDTIIRIACRELESWYFGDLQAVEAALNVQRLQQYASRAIYRNPDRIISPSSELAKITQGIYQKTSGSRAIGKHLTPDRNTSHSFQVFLKGIEKALKSVAP